jgi:3-hydroxyacyl-CoA dehydrogenase/enoyl-CoA hydratase/3-hydroxybutyryl-CoA epimerase
VVKAQASRADEVAKGCAFLTAIDKLPLIVKSSPGFLVNRVLGPYLMQALQRLEHGEAKEKIDEAARAFGMPMGPVELADWVGLDVCVLVGRILGIAPAGSSRLDEMVAAGKLGKKSGEGFYVWKDGRAQKGEPPQVPYDRFELERLGRELVDPLIGEAQKALDEGIVENADLVDAGIVFGTGFAPFRGGPLHFKRNEQRANVEPLRRSAAE